MENLNKNRFQILKAIKTFILGLEKLLVTFPKKDILTRDRMYNDALTLMELVIEASYESDKSKKHDFQIEALGKVNKLDFYIERAYKLKYISEKQCVNKAEELLRINKMIYVWCKNEG